MAGPRPRERLDAVVNSIVSIDDTSGYLVADAHGRSFGHVECPMFGTSPDEPDALAVRSDGLLHHRFIVPAVAIGVVDAGAKTVGLDVERDELLRFL